MRCHYEVFEVERTASTEEIKKQYKRLALRYHPDRNHGNETEAAEKFKEVSTAYAVLIDPQERKWYDDHRDAILRGGSGGKGGSGADDDGEDSTMNLWPYFNATCFSGFEDDTPKNFFSVYSEVFSNLESYERKCGDINMELIPPFGNRTSESADVLRFYNYWTNFASRMSFAWEDKYNPSDAPDRAVRRLIEKDNKVHRDAARKEYNEQVRSLAMHCKKRDPRIEEIVNAAKLKKEQDEQRRLNSKKEEKERKRLLRERNRQLELEEQAARGGADAEDPDALPVFRLADNDDHNVDRYDYCGEGASESNNAAAATPDVSNNNDEDDEEEVEIEVEAYACELCDKYFKSAGQLNQHLNSKLHKANEKQLAKKSGAGAGGRKKDNNISNSSSRKSTPAPKAVAVAESDDDEEIGDVTPPPAVVDSVVETVENDDEVSSPVAETEPESQTGGDSNDGITEGFACEVCSKHFKSESQLAQHLTSKAHKTKEKELAKEKKKESKKSGKGSSSSGKLNKDMDSLSIS